jgi:hypothetical protein
MMALTVLTNAKILVGQADLSGWTNKVELGAEADELDSTTFGSGGWMEKRGGLVAVDIAISGFWEASGAGYPDDRLFADLGVASIPMTVTPTGAVVGDVSYITKVMRPSYKLGDQVGQLLPFESKAVNDGTPLVRGLVNDNQARTITGTTTAQQLVVPTATTRVHCAIHVTAISGTATPTLTPTLQGDTVGFPSPATVATGSAMTTVGSQYLVGAYGVTTDNYYRLSYVISGTNPSFSVVASIGLGT